MLALTDLEVTRPPFEVTQERALAWLASVHAAAEATRAQLDDGDRARFAAKLEHALRHVACSPEQIARRGHCLAELEDPSGPALYAGPHGAGTEARTRLFSRIVDDYFHGIYAADATPPDELIHVTCTGYISPSGAQRLVAERRWPTRVTHAYHMGCYASIPALRIASGAVALGARRVDICHTELCSLHFDPAEHALEQLVVQSLFADGFIRYSLGPDRGGTGLRVRALHEQIAPDSTEAMSWLAGDHGMKMTLARDVPDRVAQHVRAFVLELFARAGLGLEHARRAVFAVHPGGPRIIDRVATALELSDEQVAASREVLREHGNMSSATLPHVWARVLADPAIAPGTLVPSLAFGPGLTICGALLEKR